AESRISHHGKHYSFDDVRITPKPVQQPLPAYVASFSKPSIELAARLGCGLIVAPFAAAMSFGGLKQVADLYHASCEKFGTRPGKLMCSYFTHFADNPEQEKAPRPRCRAVSENYAALVIAPPAELSTITGVSKYVTCGALP